MRRSWFWHTSEYLIQTWRVILLQNNSNCCRLKAAFYQEVPFSQPFILPERNLFWEALFCLASWYQDWLCWKELAPPYSRGFYPGWKGGIRKGGPQQDVRSSFSDRGSHRRHRVSSQLSKTFFPSPKLLSKGTELTETELESRKLPARTKGEIVCKTFLFWFCPA